MIYKSFRFLLSENNPHASGSMEAALRDLNSGIPDIMIYKRGGETMKIAIIGTGAVGGYYGALLQKNGLDVHFLVHSDYKYVREHGLVVDSVNGDMILPKVNAYRRPEDMPRCDIAVVALKTTANEALKTILPRVVKPDATIVVLQNGLGVESQVLKILPGATVMGGLCFLCANKIGPGHVRHLDYGAIRMGQYRMDEKAAGISGQLNEVHEIFTASGVPVDLTDNLGKARWEKLVWNIAFNGLSVILNADTRALIRSEPSRALLRTIMLEVIAGARSCGYDIADEFAEAMIAATEKMVPYEPSMKLDYDGKRPLEIDAIYRRPIQAAAESGYAMEKIPVIMLQLEYFDQYNRSVAPVS